MYIYIYINIYIHQHICIYIYINTHIYIYIHKYMYIYTHKHLYIYTHKHIYKHIYIYLQKIYIYIHDIYILQVWLLRSFVSSWKMDENQWTPITFMEFPQWAGAQSVQVRNHSMPRSSVLFTKEQARAPTGRWRLLWLSVKELWSVKHEETIISIGFMVIIGDYRSL